MVNPLWWALGGIVAGLVMSMWKMSQAWLEGDGFWWPVNLIATIALGERAERHDFHLPSFSAGMVLHLITSAAMGWFYGVVIHPCIDASVAVAALVMLVYVLAAWAVYQYLMMPWLAPIMRAHTRPFWLAVAHVVFGLPLLVWALL